MNIRQFITLLLPTVIISSFIYQNAHSAPLPLGTMSSPTSATCPASALSGAKCLYFTVSGCQNASGGNLDNLGVTLAIKTATNPKGTIIMYSGGPGTGMFNTDSFASYWNTNGYTIVQVAWDAGPASQGWNTDGNGTLYHACRAATVNQWAYNNTVAHKSGTAFCGIGSSGGGAELAFSLAHFANSVNGHTSETQSYLFDYVLIASGPATARVDIGCDASVYNNQNITNCGTVSYPSGSTSPVYTFAAGSGNIIDPWEGTSTCGSANPPAADVATWGRDSVISSGTNALPNVFTYAATNVSFYFCGSATNNQSLGIGWFLTQQIVPLNKTAQGLAPVNCFTNCTEESVWNDANAVTQTKSDMLKYCVLNSHS